jgi:hypothetical protein
MHGFRLYAAPISLGHCGIHGPLGYFERGTGVARGAGQRQMEAHRKWTILCKDNISDALSWAHKGSWDEGVVVLKSTSQAQASCLAGAKGQLWTVDRLEERGLQHPPHCPLCCQESEMIEHLTMQCSFSRDVWYKILLPFNLHDWMPAADDTLALWWPLLSDAIPARHRKEINLLVILVAR